MWGSPANWADKLQRAAQNPGAIVQRIGEVVAPALSDDEEDGSYYSDEEYDDEEEEYYVEGEGDDDAEHRQGVEEEEVVELDPTTNVVQESDGNSQRQQKRLFGDDEEDDDDGRLVGTPSTAVADADTMMSPSSEALSRANEVLKQAAMATAGLEGDYLMGVAESQEEEGEGGGRKQQQQRMMVDAAPGEEEEDEPSTSPSPSYMPTTVDNDESATMPAAGSSAVPVTTTATTDYSADGEAHASTVVATKGAAAASTAAEGSNSYVPASSSSPAVRSSALNDYGLHPKEEGRGIVDDAAANVPAVSEGGSAAATAAAVVEPPPTRSEDEGGSSSFAVVTQSSATTVGPTNYMSSIGHRSVPDDQTVSLGGTSKPSEVAAVVSAEAKAEAKAEVVSPVVTEEGSVPTTGRLGTKGMDEVEVRGGDEDGEDGGRPLFSPVQGRGSASDKIVGGGDYYDGPLGGTTSGASGGPKEEDVGELAQRIETGKHVLAMEVPCRHKEGDEMEQQQQEQQRPTHDAIGGNEIELSAEPSKDIGSAPGNGKAAPESATLTAADMPSTSEQNGRKENVGTQTPTKEEVGSRGTRPIAKLQVDDDVEDEGEGHHDGVAAGDSPSVSSSLMSVTEGMLKEMDELHDSILSPEGKLAPPTPDERRIRPDDGRGSKASIPTASASGSNGLPSLTEAPTYDEDEGLQIRQPPKEEEEEVGAPPILLAELEEAKSTIAALQQQLMNVQNEAETDRANYEQSMTSKLRSLAQSCKDLQSQTQSLHDALEAERKSHHDTKLHYGQELEEATLRAAVAEQSLAQVEAEQREDQRRTHDTEAKQQMIQRRLLEESQINLEKYKAKIDEQQREVEQFQKVVSDMRSSMRTVTDRATRAERTVEALTEEREELEERLSTVVEEADVMKAELVQLREDSSTLEGLQMELRLLQEERSRDREKIQSKQEVANTNQAKLASERDAAMQESRDLEQQLAATLADLDLARTDKDRAVTASENLQRALEAFQSERDAESAIYEEQRRHSEVATQAAHAAEIEAMKESMEAKSREVQMAAEAAVKNVMDEVQNLERTVEQYRKDNEGLRRSLDEAIYRLQASQEDVVDRALMKNVLLDWHSRKGHARKEVLAMMSSLLHFTEEEREKVGLVDGQGVIGKVAGVVAAPLPAAALNADKIEGDNVREKWVNFLLAETGGDDDVLAYGPDGGSTAANGQK